MSEGERNGLGGNKTSRKAHALGGGGAGDRKGAAPDPHSTPHIPGPELLTAFETLGS
jgi:hypothetical protein